jgi:hypothetical protein
VFKVGHIVGTREVQKWDLGIFLDTLVRKDGWKGRRTKSTTLTWTMTWTLYLS